MINININIIRRKNGRESGTPPSALGCIGQKRSLEMPSDVIDDLGFGLYQAQIGEHPDVGKTLTGFASANVIELVQDHKGDTFRAVYTVRFSEIIVVLHAFQKKSKKGSATPKQDMDLIHSRLKLAEQLYKLWKKKKGDV